MNVAVGYLVNALAATFVGYGVHVKTRYLSLAIGAWLTTLMGLFYLLHVADAVAK